MAVLLATVGVLGGIFWSLAYVNGVYNREHTWLTASRWMYENIPSGSTILWEVWDDPLPKTIPDEPGMDMYSRGLTNIDWSPYEEDTADKYEILKQKLREADYVAYSSKRIYDSVDELPQRYPMTTLYYQAMRDGRLGFELAGEFTSPPQLFGITFDDRHADESWSLYDHPQVSVFKKVRDLSDAEFDALFDHLWETAQPYYRGPDSPLSPFLNLIGLGSAPGSENAGLINKVIGLLGGNTGQAATPTLPEDRKSLMLDKPLRELRRGGQLPVEYGGEQQLGAGGGDVVAAADAAGLAGVAAAVCGAAAAARPGLFRGAHVWVAAGRLAAVDTRERGAAAEPGDARVAVGGAAGGAVPVRGVAQPGRDEDAGWPATGSCCWWARRCLGWRTSSLSACACSTPTYGSRGLAARSRWSLRFSTASCAARPSRRWTRTLRAG